MVLLKTDSTKVFVFICVYIFVYFCALLWFKRVNRTFILSFRYDVIYLRRTPASVVIRLIRGLWFLAFKVFKSKSTVQSMCFTNDVSELIIIKCNLLLLYLTWTYFSLLLIKRIQSLASNDERNRAFRKCESTWVKCFARWFPYEN